MGGDSLKTLRNSQLAILFAPPSRTATNLETGDVAINIQMSPMHRRARKMPSEDYRSTGGCPSIRYREMHLIRIRADRWRILARYDSTLSRTSACLYRARDQQHIFLYVQRPTSTTRHSSMTEQLALRATPKRSLPSLESRYTPPDQKMTSG